MRARVDRLDPQATGSRRTALGRVCRTRLVMFISLPIREHLATRTLGIARRTLFFLTRIAVLTLQSLSHSFISYTPLQSPGQ